MCSFNTLIKELNRLKSKTMSNIYLTVPIRKTNVLFQLFKFKKFVPRSVFDELQLTQISLKFQASCCNLKIRDQRAKACMAFLF